MARSFALDALVPERASLGWLSKRAVAMARRWGRLERRASVFVFGAARIALEQENA
jgi:hypothetical protein